jgi:hypothetical protein
MSLEKIQQALLARFITDYGTDWKDKIAYENMVLNPPPASGFLSVHFMPGKSAVATLGTDGQDEEEGLLQVSIFVPLGAGEGSIRAIVNSLRTSFKPQVLTYDGQPVTLLSRSRGTGKPSDAFYVVPFQVHWRARLTRN